MKKLVLFLVVYVIFLEAQGQLFTLGGVDIGYAYVGPKLGGSMAFMTNTNANNDNVPLIGYMFGALGKFGITQKLGIQVGVDYTKKGYAQSFSGGGDTKTIANYLGIPILAKLSILKIGDLRFHGTGGVYSNVAISIKEKPSGSFDHEIIFTSSQTKRVDFGFNIGAGFEYDLGHGILALDLFYEQGLVDVFKDNVKLGRNTTQAFGLSVTYLYDLGNLLAFGDRKVQE
ncbi:MAG: porin family protein [Salinivirgaceae bacterium]|nr:porin family protein [Salinivirgaceae bacterium]MDD4745973.1 porin family protein [Salinivirgaceae bacterium]MDY0282721.1 porin family protein [Salinivirgaceae bacterium]